MKKANLLVLGILVFMIFGFMSSVLGLTGSIGNARMTLRDVQAGDVIEKYILVQNVNSVPVDIELFASGDLENDIEIIDSNFMLGAGEEKKAYFKIKVREEGTTETKMNVKFSPIDGGNGVGLSSTITVIAEKGPGFFESFFEGDSEEEVISNSSVKKSNNSLMIGLSITAVVFFILIILLMFANKVRRNNLVKSKKDKNEK